MISKNKEAQNESKPDQANPDTTASVLQATFQHYFGMAMDHHTKAATKMYKQN
jgi:hypothetical protein